MGKRLKVKAGAIKEAESLIRMYPRKELRIEKRNVMRDMSVAIVDKENFVIPFNDLKKGESLLALSGSSVGLKVEDIAEDFLILKCEMRKKTYEVKLGETVTTDSLPGGTRYFPGDIFYKLEFQYFTLKDKMFEILQSICDEHARSDTNQTIFPNTTHKEYVVLRLIEELIEEDNKELYVLKAILMASNNWSTGYIMRMSLFRSILLEAIEKGCLAPEFGDDWDWLSVAADNNDPSEFMNDMDRWYDILATATEHGNEVARELMNRIWEPEQIIEED